MIRRAQSELAQAEARATAIGKRGQDTSDYQAAMCDVDSARRELYAAQREAHGRRDPMELLYIAQGRKSKEK
jgi:hypothetical protein